MQQILKESPVNIPNLLTLLRIVLVPAIAWRFRRGDSMGALLLYLIAMLSDAADGMLARKLNQITSAGKLLDPIADKLCMLTMLSLFAADGQIPVWLLHAAWLKEAILILGSIAALRQGIVVSALPIGKFATAAFVLSTAVRFLALKWLADMLLWICVALSLAALGWYSALFFKTFLKEKAIA